MLFTVILVLILLACSAFFSAAETALFSLSRLELRRLADDRRVSARLAAQLMQQPRRLLLTLMIGNVSAGIFVFATTLSLLERLTGGHSALAAVLGLASPVLVTTVGDILPKAAAIALRVPLAVRTARIVRVCQVLLWPLNLVLSSVLIEPLTRLLAGATRPPECIGTDELRELVEVSQAHRIIDADENAMLAEVIRLNELKVRDVMVPRVDVKAFDLADGPGELRRLFNELRFGKIPVYEGDIDHIIGVVYAKDFFLAPERPLRSMVRPVPFVPEIITLTQLLAHFKRSRTQLAIAVDEYGGMTGLVTVEDVAEQIVGDLSLPDEAEELPLWESLGENRYRVHGGVSVREWAERFGLNPLEEPVTTLGGLVLSRLGRLPAVGDEVRLQNVRLTVESLRGRRIERLLVELDRPWGDGLDPQADRGGAR